MAKPLVFNTSKAIAQSPFAENAFMFCCDNETVVGASRINTSPINTPEAANTFEKILKIEIDHAIDDEGNVWEYDISTKEWTRITTGTGSCNGMNAWKGYIFRYRGTNIDVITASNGSLVSGWQSDRGQVGWVGQDDVLYIGDENIVRSVTENAGQNFNPSNSSTYTYNDEALDLPESEEITTMSEIGRYLAMGCFSGNVYLWDRVSSSFELPVKIPGIIRMLIPAQEALYAVTQNGDIYITNGVSASLVFKFPRHILDVIDDPKFELYPHAYRVEKDKIFIGYGSGKTRSPMGIYSYNLTTKDFKLDYIPSSGEFGGSEDTQLLIRAIQAEGNFLFGYQVDSSTRAENYIDRLPDEDQLEDKYGSYTAKIYSPLFTVGNSNNKTTYKNVEVNCANRLATGSAVRVSYRESLNGAWNVIGTFDTVNESSAMLEKAITSLQKIQLRAELTSTDNNSPQLMNITLWQ